MESSWNCRVGNQLDYGFKLVVSCHCVFTFILLDCTLCCCLLLSHSCFNITSLCSPAGSQLSYSFTFYLVPLFHLPPPLAPVSPLPPFQTNGAYNRHTKNSHNTKSVHFFFFPSVCLFLFLMLLFLSLSLFLTFLRREMNNGGKACQLIHQLAAHV